MSIPTLHRSRSTSTEVEDRSDTSRLRLKPATTTATGAVDGGWWPGSQDLQAELPGLLELLADRLGSVERVSYHLGDWADGAQKVRVDDRLLRLSGFRRQAAGTIDVIGPRDRLTLLVVPSGTSSSAAQHILETAAQPDNADGVASLLAPVEAAADPAGDR